MLAFYIIADIAPLGLYRQPLCKSRFTGMLKTSVSYNSIISNIPQRFIN